MTDDDNWCHRTGGACSGRACWVCVPEQTITEPKDDE